MNFTQVKYYMIYNYYIYNITIITLLLLLYNYIVTKISSKFTSVLPSQSKN